MTALEIIVGLYLSGAVPPVVVAAGHYCVVEAKGDLFRVSYVKSIAGVPDEWLSAAQIRQRWPNISEARQALTYEECKWLDAAKYTAQDRGDYSGQLVAAEAQWTTGGRKHVR